MENNIRQWIAEMRELESLAPKAPWSGEQSGGRDCVWFDVLDAEEREILNAETMAQPSICHVDHREAAKLGLETSLKLVDFIARSRNALPALLDALELVVSLPCACPKINAGPCLRCAALTKLAEACR